MKLLYELEYDLYKARQRALDAIIYNTMSIRELLDLGFDNTFIKLEDRWYNLGYKWRNLDYKTNTFYVGYDSDSFGELTEDQLNCIVKYVSSELSDDNYLQVRVELVNKRDKKYFK